MEKGTVYFFTGLAGAGKTTIGGLFYRRLKEKKPNVVMLDGGQLRRLSTNKYSGYSTEERRKGAFYNFEMCSMLADQGIDVVLCSISMYNDCRAWARENIENYREIYIRTTWETLYRRDQKRLYSSGTKNVVGVDLLCEEPEHPDIIIDNNGQETPEEIVNQLWGVLGVEESV